MGDIVANQFIHKKMTKFKKIISDHCLINSPFNDEWYDPHTHTYILLLSLSHSHTYPHRYIVSITSNSSIITWQLLLSNQEHVACCDLLCTQ